MRTVTEKHVSTRYFRRLIILGFMTSAVAAEALTFSDVSMSHSAKVYANDLSATQSVVFGEAEVFAGDFMAYAIPNPVSVSSPAGSDITRSGGLRAISFTNATTLSLRMDMWQDLTFHAVPGESVTNVFHHAQRLRFTVDAPSVMSIDVPQENAIAAKSGCISSKRLLISQLYQRYS